jgi:outer membrane receptor protein involved in Fe transport
MSSTWTLRAAAYTGFRIPTLNELYRPFRVGNDITEANPALKPERLIGVEAGIDAKPTDDLALSVTYFNNRLNDAISNVTVQTTPGTNAALNVVVPAGGVLRQRRNIERTTAEGVEADGTWKASAAVELTARFLYTDPEVTRSRDAPNLIGLLLPEVSRYQAFVGASWHPAAGMTLHGDVHLASSQFDDDLNTRKLSGYAVANLTAEAMITRALSVFAGIDNLFDRTIEAGESATGVFTVGSPRTFQGGLRLTF